MCTSRWTELESSTSSAKRCCSPPCQSPKKAICAGPWLTNRGHSSKRRSRRSRTNPPTASCPGSDRTPATSRPKSATQTPPPSHHPLALRHPRPRRRSPRVALPTALPLRCEQNVHIVVDDDGSRIPANTRERLRQRLTHEPDATTTWHRTWPGPLDQQAALDGCGSHDSRGRQTSRRTSTRAVQPRSLDTQNGDHSRTRSSTAHHRATRNRHS